MKNPDKTDSIATAEEQSTPPPRFRWRLLAVLYFGLVGGLYSLIAIGHAATMLYVRVQYGPVEPHPSTPSLNSVAPTLPNFIHVASALVAGAAGIVAARWWWKGRWKHAIAASLISVVGQVAASQFGSFS